MLHMIIHINILKLYFSLWTQSYSIIYFQRHMLHIPKMVNNCIIMHIAFGSKMLIANPSAPHCLCHWPRQQRLKQPLILLQIDPLPIDSCKLSSMLYVYYYDGVVNCFLYITILNELWDMSKHSFMLHVFNITIRLPHILMYRSVFQNFFWMNSKSLQKLTVFALVISVVQFVCDLWFSFFLQPGPSLWFELCSFVIKVYKT